jgi:hypothetical protein
VIADSYANPKTKYYGELEPEIDATMYNDGDEFDQGATCQLQRSDMARIRNVALR